MKNKEMTEQELVEIIARLIKKHFLIKTPEELGKRILALIKEAGWKSPGG